MGRNNKVKTKSSNHSIYRFAGAWSDVSEDEIKNMKKSMKDMWKRWNI